ncbi:probable E3 ubiquitin-protein ligase IRF2BPL [Fundulus heteroclitus]|uniref:probable E3 ubiquitin-protein ligase IRF2BPL n=1 Tax=Fundulus heteroclitus TaxID=8078 RepID=UPI00165A1452|nr:probable E3 ubiquitin-protein ligase IRF2BPL [Fundulus heteroclitus]
METNGPDQPTAMQRLEQTEREVNHMAGDMASMLQIGHQQQQQFQQQQQQIQQQQQQLAMIIQLLTNLNPSSASTSSVPASQPSSPALASPAVDQAPAALSSGPAPESPVLVMAAAAEAPEPKIGNPERFNGDPTQFSEEMLKVFDLESTTTEASRTLMCIRQGRSLADYIKDELVAHDQPSTLDEAIALAVRIDHRIQARRPLVDSGAEANIMDTELARQLGVESHQLPAPIPVRTLEGLPANP